MKRTVSVKAGQFFGMPGFPIRLHLRNDLHLARKLWHMLMGLIMVAVYMSGMSRSTGVFLLGCVLGLNLLLETARLRSPFMNEKIMRIWGPLMRTQEVHKLSGIPYYLSAAILAIGIFPKPIAVLSILYLAFGDPIASVFGILYGKRGMTMSCGKSLIGTLAGVVTCMLVTYVFLNSQAMTGFSLLVLTVVGGLAGGAAELFLLKSMIIFQYPLFQALFFGFPSSF